jgi:N-acetylmuramic acid 6-phosphate (MurNAc-6-P) etherase
VPLNKAKVLFLNADKNPKLAIVMFLRNCNIKKANLLLKEAKCDLRKVIS